MKLIQQTSFEAKVYFPCDKNIFLVSDRAKNQVKKYSSLLEESGEDCYCGVYRILLFIAIVCEHIQIKSVLLRFLIVYLNHSEPKTRVKNLL